MKQSVVLFFALILTSWLAGPRTSMATTTESKEVAETEYPDDIPAEKDVIHILLPYVGFDSDIGFTGGVMWNRYFYDEGLSPFGNITEIRASASTKGMMRGRVTHERINAWESPFRYRVELVMERLLSDNYFGTGNISEWDSDLWDDKYYNFESRAVDVTLDVRYPLLYADHPDQLDLLLLAGGLYFRAYEPGDESSLLFDEGRPVNNRTFLPYFGTGLLWDSRDKEFDPGSGSFAEIEIRGFPDFSSGSNGMLSINSQLQGFYSFSRLDNLTLAARIGGEWTSGTVPFWKLPEIGGEETLRGMHLKRFRDRASLYNSIALRKWLLTSSFIDFRFGLQVFTEGGRVFGSDDGFSDIFRDHHRSVGGSLLLSAFTEDLIIRADYARFEGAGRIYINIGFVY